MTALAESPKARRPFFELLLVELAPREGRWAAVTRIATGCCITVAIAMVFEIPQPTYMAYIVFLISKDEKSGTITSALGGLVAVTLAVVLTLVLSLIDTGEPALRLPLMALATFAAMFSARTFSLGPISYLAGFVIVLLLSLVDDVPSPEALTRAILWTWVVILVPVLVTVIVNILFGQSKQALMARTVRRVLRELTHSLMAGNYRTSLPQWRAQLVALPGTTPVVSTVLDTLVTLEALPDDLSLPQRQWLASQVPESGGEIASSLPTQLPPDFLLEQQPVISAILNTLSRVHFAFEQPTQSAIPEARPHRQAFVADAFSNPAHWQFALKTTIAVMLSYAIYSLLDWPGLRTAIVTCFFVALANLGETVHKLTLRLSGAVIGGLIAGLCIVFLLPHLTDIGQLCLLIGIVSLAAAWVATSSELISYGGMQIAFAFFLGVLQGYAPANDLTVLRDRIVGILLGNVIITLVFSSLWPQSATSAIRAALADTLRALSELIGRPSHIEEVRLRAARALVKADHLRASGLFELRMLPAQLNANSKVPAVADVEKLAGAAFVLASDSIARSTDPAALAPWIHWAQTAADSLSRNEPVPAAPAPALELQPLSAADPQSLLARQALEKLALEVGHVATAEH